MRDAQIRYIERANKVRGSILSLASIMERNVDGILSKYFSRDKDHQREMIELIFATERMNFRSKYKLLIDILKRKTGDRFNSEFPQLQKKFDDVTSIRNSFAHESDIPFDETSEIPDHVFNRYDCMLLILRDITKTKGYTTEEISGILEQITELSFWLDKAGEVLFKDGQVTHEHRSGQDPNLF